MVHGALVEHGPTRTYKRLPHDKRCMCETASEGLASSNRVRVEDHSRTNHPRAHEEGSNKSATGMTVPYNPGCRGCGAAQSGSRQAHGQHVQEKESKS